MKIFQVAQLCAEDAKRAAVCPSTFNLSNTLEAGKLLMIIQLILGKLSFVLVLKLA